MASQSSDALEVLDLSAVGPEFERVKDLRNRRTDPAGEPITPHRSDKLLGLILVLLGLILVVPAGVFALVSLVVLIAFLPFELLLRLVTGRSGLVLGPVMGLLSLITMPVSALLRKWAKARASCPLCGQLGTLERVVDITHNGNMRMSILGFEASVPDPGMLHVEPGQRLTVSRCEACLDHFLEGPYAD